MPRTKLSDDDVAAIRAAAQVGGESLTAIAARFGTSKQHVSRLVRGHQRQVFDQIDVQTAPSVSGAVRGLLEAAGVDAAADVSAAAALALAEKLDSVRSSTTSQSAMAAPGLARALNEILEELRATVSWTGPRLGALRGAEAVLVARELGYDDPENVRVTYFDRIEAIRVRRQRRLREATHYMNGDNNGDNEEVRS
jgi:hypothetical protein